MIGGSLGYTDGKVLGSDEGTKLGLYGDKVRGTILVDVDGITLVLDVGIVLVYLDGSFDGYNDGKLEVLLLGGSLGSNDAKVIGQSQV